jgi:hypothetical protein
MSSQNGARCGGFVAEQTEQQVLGPYVGVLESIGFLRGVEERPLCFRAEGDLGRGRKLLDEDRARLGLRAQLLYSDAELVEEAECQPSSLW